MTNKSKINLKHDCARTSYRNVEVVGMGIHPKDSNKVGVRFMVEEGKGEDSGKTVYGYYIAGLVQKGGALLTNTFQDLYESFNLAKQTDRTVTCDLEVNGRFKTELEDSTSGESEYVYVKYVSGTILGIKL